MSTDKNDIIVEALTSKITALNEQIAELSAVKNDLHQELQKAKRTAKVLADASDAVDAMSERSAALLRSFIINKHADLLPALCEYVVDTVKYKMQAEENRYDIGLLALQNVPDHVENDADRRKCFSMVLSLEELAGFTEAE
ncbi:hypothetical protein [uncultured Psychrobacter sp.]|uniref:hypothetical protein n=1 Tax=uncultured Psychrobacter sp. TaxID=259303 RepID=UPI002596C407|nr:hypothetical protein [uncultured Psychrobacter sp.]